MTEADEILGREDEITLVAFKGLAVDSLSVCEA